MREIGGYFGFEQLAGREYYPTLTALNTARNSLLYLIRARHITKLYIPFYLCGSVADLCRREGCEFEHYPAGRDFMPVFTRSLSSGEYLYVVNYYGQITNDIASDLKARHGNIILDNVQAFFQEPPEGIDTIYSCRKFFGVPDGAYLSTDSRLEAELDCDHSAGRMTHILGRCEGRSASDYYNDFKKNDESFRELPLLKMSWLTHNLLGAIDYGRVITTRNSNYETLSLLLSEHNALKIKRPFAPFAYPFYVRDGMAIKKRLAERKIYVATLWPDALECGDEVSQDYAANILPLPCDQRYNREDMNTIASEVMRYVQA